MQVRKLIGNLRNSSVQLLKKDLSRAVASVKLFAHRTTVWCGGCE